MRRGWIAAAMVLVLAACGSGDEGGGSGTDGSEGGTGGAGGSGGSGGTGGTGGTAAPVDWETCYLEGAGRAECATLQVPLDRDDPASPTIPFFVRRLATPGESRGQLWLLEGGPGVNGGQLGFYAAYFLLDLGLDIYMPDYRGVGRSANLGCEEGVSPRVCMADLEYTYRDDLVRFSTSEAVRDVGEAIERLRRPGEQVFVWGTSYGTVTGHRFLHLFPDLADGVVLDSACGAAGCDMEHSDVDLDRNAHDLADLCAADEFCRGKLGDDPWGKVADVFARIEDGHCEDAFAGTSPYWIRPIFAQLMGPYFQPSVGMALVARLDRCDPADAAAVANLLEIFVGGSGGWAIQDSVQQSDLLYYNIVFNEFWNPATTEEDLERLENGLVVRTGAVSYFPSRYAAWSWPRYEVPADLKRWADVETPVLVLNGTLDAQTRHERMVDAADAFTGANQHVVIVPYGAHGLFNSSGPASDAPGVTCGAHLTRQFLADPTAALDVSCLDEQTPPRFDTAQYQSYWFGTPDLYENVQAARPAITELDDPWARARLEEARARLRQRIR